MKQLAQRFGMTIPETEQTDEQRASAAERESTAQDSRVGSRMVSRTARSPRRQLASGDRSPTAAISDTTARRMGLGFAPPSRTALKQALLKQGYSEGLLVRAGLLVQREEGPSDGPVQESADDPHPPRHRVRHRVRRAALLMQINNRSI